jgi:hypothetical protein
MAYEGMEGRINIKIEKFNTKYKIQKQFFEKPEFHYKPTFEVENV